jgi:hypothetical protein
MPADPGHAVVWAAADPDENRAGATLVGAARRFLGADGGRPGRLSVLVLRAVAAADRVLRERRGRWHGQGG